MEDKCPECGISPASTCVVGVEKYGGLVWRDKACKGRQINNLKTQIIALQSGLREAIPMVKIVASVDGSGMRSKAAAILPTLEDLVKEG